MTNMLTIVGNLARDPETRTTRAGKTYARATIAHTPRRYNNQTNQWEDAGETLWLNTTIWGRTADHAATLHKGDRVLAVGKLQANTWEDKNGNKRTDIQLVADTLAVIPKTTSHQPAQPQNNNWTQNANGAWGNTTSNAWNTNTGDEAPPF